jgi:hypothetical protein
MLSQLKAFAGTIGILAGSLAVTSLTCAAAAPSEWPRISGTFLQLLDEHQTWSKQKWEELFASLQALQQKQIVVQWVVSDRRASYLSKRFASGATDVLEEVLRRSDEAGMQVTIGLARTTDYWSRIEGPAPQVSAYFQALRTDSVAAATELKPRLAGHRSFSGWYLPEEIDDVNWRKPDNRKVLLNHITALTTTLHELTPGVPVLLSTFSQGRSSPDGFADFWKTALAQSHVDKLLFQDGIGVRNLNLQELDLYLGALNAAGLGPKVTPVIELFEQTEGPPLDERPFKAKPAAFERILEQLKVEAVGPRQSVFGFSVPEYMTPIGGPLATDLYNRYRAELSVPVDWTSNLK